MNTGVLHHGSSRLVPSLYFSLHQLHFAVERDASSGSAHQYAPQHRHHIPETANFAHLLVCYWCLFEMVLQYWLVSLCSHRAHMHDYVFVFIRQVTTTYTHVHALGIYSLALLIMYTRTCPLK